MPDQIDSATTQTSEASSSGAQGAPPSLTARVAERTAQPSPATASETDPKPGSEKARDFFNRAIRGARPSTEPASQPRSDASHSTEGEGEQGNPSDQADPAKAAQPTAAEIEERRIQSEVDKRLARLNKEATAKQRRDQEVTLRKTDPYAYAQLKEQEEAQQQQATAELTRVNSALNAWQTNVDRALVDPIFKALPAKDQAELLKEHAKLDGLEHRAAIAKSSLDRLEKHWKAQGATEAEAKLRKNPSFTKQILTELRGEQDEPEIISGSVSRESSSGDMNAWMRNAVGGRRHTSKTLTR